ncbi:hypothetical protein DPMN_184877 [Dreissena polymorpha]|uniref:C1q domain-containing protein n=1 Tax=Dreissena polymorpha TaxID=45954 RepID=A0A9D4I508_DREPO|nr:hypothetical protein DPMN_184877 [Dreissena polymorpha]
MKLQYRYYIQGHVVAFNDHGFNELSNCVNASPTLIVNEGNAYNPNTGHFTAPVDGISYFTAQICCKPGYDAYFNLENGSENICVSARLTATEQLEYNYNSCTFASCSVKPTIHGHVWVLFPVNTQQHL